MTLSVILDSESVHHPMTGIGYYTLELGRQLAAREELSVMFIHQRRLLAHPPDPPQAAADAPYPRAPLWKRAAGRALGLTRDLLEIRKRRALRDSVYHGPNYTVPAHPGPTVATIHDLSVFRWPQFHPPARVRYMEKAISRTLKRADRLITDSNFVKEEVVRDFAWDPARIDVVALGARSCFRPAPTATVRESLRPLGLTPGGYLLCTATMEPRKNLERLVDAIALLPAAVRRRWPLVLCGDKGWHSDALREKLRAHAGGGWLRTLGYVSDEDLAMLMAGARLFVQPSLYEGFGLPVLEAMATGAPVACASVSSLPEVAGSAAAYFTPEDTEAMSRCIAETLEDETRLATMRASSIERAKCFSWARCATETAESYRKAAR